MKIDTSARTGLDEMAGSAVSAERDGYDGFFTSEIQHDPFLPLILAIEHTERIQIGTQIAVAFARNPMTLANLGYDLQSYSYGRFILGLGSQIRPHIERRFSMPWSEPADRMRELVLAIRAIWESWQQASKLQFEGKFYRHTLMTPFFDPGPNPYGCARVFLAAVGDRMTEVAGEVADGLFVHAFTTASYVRDVTLPALDRGLGRRGAVSADIERSVHVLVATGRDEDETAIAARAVRKQLAFYGSTPAYRPVLAHHGWSDTQVELNRLSKLNRWEEMADVIDSAMLDEFAVVAEPDHVAEGILSRFGNFADRVSLYTPYDLHPAVVHRIVTDLHSARSTQS
jgi:probable F420-dependent oxidoreductase